MPHQSFSHPDAMPLREALRGLRFLLRRGTETVTEIVHVKALPGPAADIANSVLREAVGLAKSVDDIASGMAKTLLGGQDRPTMALQDIIDWPGSDAAFAAAFYVAMNSVLQSLGAPAVFVSEAAARSAFAGLTARIDPVTATQRAAELSLRLMDARVVRGITVPQTALVPDTMLAPVSIFAVTLWLLSARSEDENEAALGAATDMAVALAPRISQAFEAKDLQQVDALYSKYASHV